MMIPVTVRSSSLAQIACDGRRAILQVEFRDGTACQYAGVPLGTYQELLQADSKGAYSVLQGPLWREWHKSERNAEAPPR